MERAIYIYLMLNASAKHFDKLSAIYEKLEKELNRKSFNYDSYNRRRDVYRTCLDDLQAISYTMDFRNHLLICNAN